jgi:hypothetical protein
MFRRGGATLLLEILYICSALMCHVAYAPRQLVVCNSWVGWSTSFLRELPRFEKHAVKQDELGNQFLQYIYGHLVSCSLYMGLRGFRKYSHTEQKWIAMVDSPAPSNYAQGGRGLSPDLSVDWSTRRLHHLIGHDIWQLCSVICSTPSTPETLDSRALFCCAAYVYSVQIFLYLFSSLLQFFYYIWLELFLSTSGCSKNEQMFPVASRSLWTKFCWNFVLLTMWWVR